MSSFSTISDVLGSRVPVENESSSKPTVNSENSKVNTVNSQKEHTYTVNSTQKRIKELMDDLNVEPEIMAKELSETLDDLKSLKFYILLCKNNDIGKIMEALSFTNTASRDGQIKRNKAVYFMGICKKWCLITKFKKDH